MKFKYYVVFFGLLFILSAFFFVSCSKEESQYIKANDRDTALSLGLQRELINENQVLSIEYLKDSEELIFFSNDSALGFAWLSKNGDEWLWARTKPMYNFQPSKTSAYMTSMLEISSIKGNNYYLYLGKLFSPDIHKVTFLDDKITAEIKKTNNSIFCYAVVDTEQIVTNFTNLRTKSYDISGKLITTKND